jgi:hypothetical protein
MTVDLMSIVRSNYQARQLINDMNLADICKKYGIDLSQARKLKNYCALLEIAE